MQSILTRALIAGFLLGGLACSRNPVTGKREVILMSKEQEIAIGQQSHPSVVASMGLYEDKKLQDFINEKGKAMAAISHRPDLPYQFYIVDSPVVNAFAVPGGYVYFTRGIMAHFNNEAEFAGVLGHEIGHITARHSARQQTSQLLGTLGAIGVAIAVPQLGESVMQGAQVLFLKYSRDHESESDKIGVEYSSKIGYNAVEMANFFGTIKRIQDNAGQAVPTFLSTHPDPGNRLTRVQGLAKEFQAANPRQYAVERDRYLRMIDGIVYGEDPKQGFVENNMFYHPVLKFQFPVPQGWKHQNSPEQFQMGAADGKSAMILMLAKGNSLEEAAQTMVKELNLKVLENGRTTINGNPALVIISQQQPQQQQGQPQQQQSAQNTLQLATWLIQYNGGIYALHGLSSAADFNSRLNSFRSVAENFRALTDRDKLNRQPERVQVVQAPRDGSFRDVMSALNMPSNRLEELGTLNSMRADDRVNRGMLVKVIQR
ncbi:M48 family metalloprotease [Rudanella lutea]|uniref:M48 family metalloprotease n=1 Tax=Rudanella lutea TaxID=451374 RepID=UPI000369782C|nr:M48 family metalloprotease [Rudanella lutea]